MSNRLIQTILVPGNLAILLQPIYTDSGMLDDQFVPASALGRVAEIMHDELMIN